MTASRDRAASDPAQPDPAQPDPAQPEPAQPDPARPESVAPDAVESGALDLPGEAPAGLGGESVAVLAPLHRDRIKAALEANRMAYRVDSDLDICAVWKDARIWFSQQGTGGHGLFLFAWWRGELGIEQRLEALEAINEEHIERLWPKLHLRTGDEGRVSIAAEFCVDCSAGVSDAQLAAQVDLGVWSIMSAFEALAERFPRALPDED